MFYTRKEAERFLTILSSNDIRNRPEEYRQRRFIVGWEAAVSWENYTEDTLESLTWQNLGYRLGVAYGSQPKSEILRMFDLFETIFNPKG